MNKLSNDWRDDRLSMPARIFLLLSDVSKVGDPINRDILRDLLDCQDLDKISAALTPLRRGGVIELVGIAGKLFQYQVTEGLFTKGYPVRKAKTYVKKKRRSGYSVEFDDEVKALKEESGL